MRKSLFIATAAFILLVLLASACSPAKPASPIVVPTAAKTAVASDWDKVIADAKKEGIVTAYSFMFSGDTFKIVADAFQQKYGIKLEIVTGAGSVLFERIRTEHVAGKYLADTFDTSASLLAAAKSQSLTQNLGNLPVFAEKGVWELPPKIDEDGYIVPMSLTNWTMTINTNLVKPGEEPKSVKDLLDPKWGNGKIVIASPVTSSGAIIWYVTKLLDDDYLVRLAKNQPKITPTNREAVSALARGEVSIEFAESIVLAASNISQGAPIKPIELAEGIIISSGNALSMVSNAAHPNAARVFVNWLLSQDGQKVLNSAQSTTPVRSDLPSFLPQAANIKYKKVTNLSLNQLLEVSKIQQEGSIARIFGVAK